MKTKPRHTEPTNWEHCCNCCPKLEEENEHLKKVIHKMQQMYEYK